MVLIAWSCALIICFTHFSSASLSVLIISDGVRHGEYPKRTWLGDRLVVMLIWLLCTANAMEIQYDQSLGCEVVIVCKYCSIHWFFHLDSPSV